MANTFLHSLSVLSLLLLTHCNNDSITPKIYRYSVIMNSGGTTRAALLNLPGKYYEKDSATFPLVIALHGTGGSAHQMERTYGLTEKANESNFIIVYPEGVRNDGIFGIRTWNAGTCCDYARENNINDVGFIVELMNYLIDTYRIDPAKIYVTGMSNGGMMAYRLACEIPERIAAIAPVSATMVMHVPCSAAREVPILHIHSMQDTKVPYAGGIGLGDYYFPPVDSVLNTWVSNNNCTLYPQVSDNARYVHKVWQGCGRGSVIESYLTYDGGHSWPGGMKGVDWGDEPSAVLNANDLIWDFFQRFKLP